MKWQRIIVLIAAVCFSQFVTGQKSGKESRELITITGKVLNQDKNPITGAVIYVDNIETKKVTRSNGSYKIKVSSSTVNLEARSRGYDPKKIPINGQNKIDFIMTATGEQVTNTPTNTKNEVSTDVIKNSGKSRAKKMNTYNDIYQMIRSEVSGVIVSGKSIQIEQGHSFFGSSTPLFVINGVIVPSIDNVNPVEVKSIKVLRGTAASIYGINGTNGVISITLKDGTDKGE